jgi:hypothetical protein
LVDGQKARSFLNNFRPDWHTCSVNSLGNSGGLAASWDPSKFDLHPYLSCGGILLTGTCLWNNLQINLLNSYGPCQNKKLFWDRVESRGLLDLPNLIIVGDLNFTTSSRRNLGSLCQPRSLGRFFISLFQMHRLVDFPPDVLIPTWRNGRVGSEYIAKRLDRFYLSESLSTTDGRIRSWVNTPYLSDHAPIIITVRATSGAHLLPFQIEFMLAT